MSANLVFYLGQLLGFVDFIPPYATITDKVITTGVNYASGSAGIREESGSHLVITTGKYTFHFQLYIS